MKTRVILFLLSTFVMSAPAYAAIVITIEEQGSDVIIEYSGSWENWTRDGTNSIADITVYGQGLFNTFGTTLDFMAKNTGGKGGMSLAQGSWTTVLTNADSSTGDPLAWNRNFTYAPLGYTVGDDIEGSLTFNDTDLTTMGFTDGDAGTWTGGAGSVNFSVTAIPEPNSYGFLLGAAGLATAVFFRRRRRSSAV